MAETAPTIAPSDEIDKNTNHASLYNNSRQSIYPGDAQWFYCKHIFFTIIYFIFNSSSFFINILSFKQISILANELGNLQQFSNEQYYYSAMLKHKPFKTTIKIKTNFSTFLHKGTRNVPRIHWLT